MTNCPPLPSCCANRENNTGGFPCSLNQFLRALRAWLYGRDPVEPLQWEGPLEELKAALAEGEDIFGACLIYGRCTGEPDVAVALPACQQGGHWLAAGRHLARLLCNDRWLCDAQPLLPPCPYLLVSQAP